MDRIAFTTVTFRKLSRAEIIGIAQDNGIRQIEWGGDVHLPPQDEKARGEVIHLQQESGITACSYGSYYRLGANDMALWCAITETAAAIGAKTIRIWAGDRPSAQTDEALFTAWVSEAQALADMAAKQSLTVAFEFHKGTYNDTGASSVRLLKSIDRDNVKTYWQPMTTPADDENLQAVLPYLAGIHIFNWNQSGRRFPLKFGRRRWTRLLCTVAESKKDVPLILEFVRKDRKKQFEKDAKVLRRLVQEIYGRQS